MFAVIMVYFSLLLLGVVCVISCVRIYIEYKFRQRLEERPDLLKFSQKELANELTGPAKISQIMANNKYSFEHQVNMPYRPRILPHSPSFNPIDAEEYELTKKRVRKEIYSKKSFRINVENDLFMEEIPHGIPFIKNSHSRKLLNNEVENVLQ